MIYNALSLIMSNEDETSLILTKQWVGDSIRLQRRKQAKSKTDYWRIQVDGFSADVTIWWVTHNPCFLSLSRTTSIKALDSSSVFVSWGREVEFQTGAHFLDTRSRSLFVLLMFTLHTDFLVVQGLHVLVFGIICIGFENCELFIYFLVKYLIPSILLLFLVFFKELIVETEQEIPEILNWNPIL